MTVTEGIAIVLLSCTAVIVGERLNSVVPNITIRNNQNVYVTINNFNETESQWERKE